ncbi:hypothetical protein HUJ05_001778 [Dendroctonus ponderosae]|nr:hypothetical protein HUJ05_001778 [Dendroctonus ponderosae]
MQPANRYRTYSLQVSQGQGAFPQSLSGSETDVSTSNENLSNEEKYVIRHTPRQEPQGQENLQASNRSSLRDSLPSNRSSLDVSSSSYNTLIIHSAGDEPWTVPSPSNTVSHETIHDLIGRFDTASFDINNIPAPIEYSNKWADKSPLQAAVNSRSKISSDKLALSKSQPDLTSVGIGKSDFTGFRRGVSAPRPPTKGREENDSKNEEVWPSSEMVEILIKENSALKHELENCYQRVEKTHKLEQEILKIHKSQEEIVQSCERRERLERAARARLQADSRRYQELNRALREQVDLLSTQVLSRSPIPDSNGADGLRRELNKREGIIKQLIMQSKELGAAKERQEIELAAQRATLQEQRTHIDILDTALTNAQGNVVRLEEENRKKQGYVERVAQLQRALYSLQVASDRREDTERKLRLQLEIELQRTKVVRGERKSGWDSPNGSGSESASELKRQLREKDENIMRLEGECAKWEQRYLEENALRQAAIDAASIPKDAKIAALEKTSQETEKIIAEARNEKIRHMDEVHAAQKKVADLESRLKDLESKLAEKDAMIRVLQKHTYDKDVSMLGRSPHHTPHSSLGGTDIDLGLGATVSREELVSSVLTNSTAYGSGNSYTGSDTSYHMATYSQYDTNKNFDATKKQLDNQLKEIDSQLDTQLLSKRKGKLPKPLLASVTAANERQPFDGGNSTFFTSSSRHESGEMLLLEKQGRTSQQQRMTEPSGMNNGQESSNICPSPSSLPRPPRSSHRSGLPRRIGDYNRLENTEPARKNSNGGDSLSSNASSRRPSPARSLIQPPRKLGEYGRLSESGGSSASLRKYSTRVRSGSTGERDSASTLSENSASSLPTPSKVRMYGGGLRRGNSLGREAKSSADPSKYRIQF